MAREKKKSRPKTKKFTRHFSQKHEPQSQLLRFQNP
ncbi:DUF1661 domain-containing protein [Porphyromonas gulae]